MHILFVCDHLGYSGGAWHGCTTYFLNVLPQLLRAGHRVSLCVLRGEHPAAELLRAAGVNVRFLNAPPTSLRTVWYLARTISSEGVDVIHATQRESTGHARMFGWFARRLPVVMHVVDSDPVPWLERMVNRTLPPPDLALCVSNAVRSVATDAYGVDPRRVHVLHNAIDLAKLKPSTADARARLRESLAIPADAPVIVSTSRFTAEKRLDVLVGMIPEVLAIEPRAVFVLAGAGPELDPCRERAEQLGVAGAVRFVGHRGDIPDVLAASDVAVMLCLREAFGYSAVEAMASRVPVVAYDGSGLSEVISHERNGLLVPAGDDAAFKVSLLRVVCDGALRGRLGDNARGDVGRFDAAGHAQQLVSLYAQLFSQGARPGDRALTRG